MRCTELGLNWVVCKHGGFGTKLRLETSTPAAMGDNWWKERVFIFEACWQLLGDLTLGTSAEYFVAHVSRKSSLMRNWNVVASVMLPLLSFWSHL